MPRDTKAGRKIECLKGKNACGDDRKDRDFRFVKIFPCPVYCKSNKDKSNYPEYDTNRDAESAITKQKIRYVRSVSPVYNNNTYYMISVTTHTSRNKRYYFNIQNVKNVLFLIDHHLQKILAVLHILETLFTDHERFADHLFFPIIRDHTQ